MFDDFVGLTLKVLIVKAKFEDDRLVMIDPNLELMCEYEYTFIHVENTMYIVILRILSVREPDLEFQVNIKMTLYST